jgi:NAD(P)-dependent dehydrogenase (short-subunit alcohol dehydrogenase family)
VQTTDRSVALVTGANGGLGRYITQTLLDARHRVVGVSRKIRQSDFDSPLFTAVAAEISVDGTKKIVADIIAGFGQLDIVVHTVGGFAGGQTIAETDVATFQRMLDLNLNSAFHLLRAVLPAMKKNGGRIVAIGSRASVDPGPGVGAYSASKAALVSLMRTAALENKESGITVNTILPGTMDTPANRLAMPGADFSKWVQPERVASLVAWLVGNEGKDVNGAAIPVYGNDI